MNRFIVRTATCSTPLQANDLTEACFNACVKLYGEAPRRVKAHQGQYQGYNQDGEPIGEPYTVVRS